MAQTGRSTVPALHVGLTACVWQIGHRNVDPLAHLMTLRVCLLAGSLALNVACFAVFALRPAISPGPVRDFFVRNFQRSAEVPPPAAKPVTPKPVARQQLWPALDAGEDLPTLVGRLRAAGFPPEIIRAMVLAEISARYDAKMRAMFEPDPNTPFWKLTTNFFSSGDKRMEQYSAMQRERAKLQRELFADPFFSTDDVTAAQRRQFGNLSKQKIDVLQRIEDDYAEMTSAIRSATNGILLAEDREKMALLQREKLVDLASVLSPQELADYQMRSSPVANMLVRQLGGFNASEAEFRAIFQAQNAFSERVASTSPSLAGNYEDRRAAQQQLNDQLKASLGDTRFADYLRETDRNYQQLLRLAERENIPKETALRAYNVRDNVAVESHRIADDGTLTLEQKRFALQALADRTRNELLGILGPAAGPTYVKVVDQQWLSMVQRGNAVSFTGNTGSMTMSMGGSGSSGLPISISFGASPSFRNIAQPTPPPGK